MNLPNWNDLFSKKGRIAYAECKASEENKDKQILLKYYNEMTCSITFCFCKTEGTYWKASDKPKRRGWSSAGNEKALLVPRHTPHKKTLKVADYVDKYLGKLSPYLPNGSDEYAFIAYEGDTTGNHGTGKPERSPEIKYGFWLIDPTPFPNVSASRADFVYAIFHTFKFEKHCDKVETDYKTAHPKSNSQRHFDSETKWDTFTINRDIGYKLSGLTLPPDVVTLFKEQGYDITVITVEEAIALAGKWLRDGWKKYSPKFDDCINALLGI